MDRKRVEHIATLAKLNITEGELQAYTEQLSKIFGYFESLSKVDTSSVEPLVTASDIEYWTRNDEVKVGLSAEDLLKPAPARAGNLYTVPPVV
ncbi:MAG: Asp-tRNA(Asn)/Glu-tRNA(Gln) amidotransferase subunit GatC [Bdellovibrionia bacterium]